MAKICEHCGNKNNSFLGDPFYLSDDKILCYKCAQNIRNDINNLYYVKTNAEFEELKNIVLDKCSISFDTTITESVANIINQIYDKSSFAKNDEVVCPTERRPASANTTPYVSSHDSDTSYEMFDNIGGKIKALAKVSTWIGIIASFILGAFIMSLNNMFLIGLLVMFLGGLISWVSSFALYGFGQLIENSDKLVKKLKK